MLRQEKVRDRKNDFVCHCLCGLWSIWPGDERNDGGDYALFTAMWDASSTWLPTIWTRVRTIFVALSYARYVVAIRIISPGSGSCGGAARAG